MLRFNAKRIRTIFCLLAPMAASPAMGCSIFGSTLFKPTLERFNFHPGPAQIAREAGTTAPGDYWEGLPAPIITIQSIERGHAPVTSKKGVTTRSSCDDVGTITLSVKLPSESTYDIKQFGIYFRVVRGQLPDAIFPTVPLVPAEGRENLIFAWPDSAPPRQKELDFEVEAFLVSHGLDIGPSTRFLIKN